MIFMLFFRNESLAVFFIPTAFSAQVNARFCLPYATKLQAVLLVKRHRVRWPLIFSSIMSFRLLFILPTEVECLFCHCCRALQQFSYFIRSVALQIELNKPVWIAQI